MNPNDPAPRLGRARLLDELQRTDASLEAYAAAAARAHDAEPYIALADALLRAGRASDAAAPAEAACARFPKDPRAWHVAGRVQAAGGDTARALALLERSLGLRDDPAVRLDRARVLSETGRAAEALDALGEAPGTDAAALLLRADLLQTLGRTADALAACDAAGRADARARDVAFDRKGKMLLHAGRAKEAASAFDAALGLNPREPDYWCDAALAWSSCGQTARARSLLERALRLEPRFERALRLRETLSAADSGESIHDRE